MVAANPEGEMNRVLARMDRERTRGRILRERAKKAKARARIASMKKGRKASRKALPKRMQRPQGAVERASTSKRPFVPALPAR